jgi:hypothetical protein
VPVVKISPRGRRLLASGLIAYGLGGLLLIAASGVLVGGAITTLADVSERVTQQRDALVATLRATSLTVDHAATGIRGVSDSLTAARASADQATGLARSLGSTFRDLSAAMQLQIFGTQPLAGLASGFDNAASQSEALATNLDGVSTALGTNATDLQTSHEDLVALGDRLDVLVASLGTSDLGGASLSAGVPAVVIEAAFAGLLIWLAIPAAAALAVGVGLLRGTLR